MHLREREEVQTLLHGESRSRSAAESDRMDATGGTTRSATSGAGIAQIRASRQASNGSHGRTRAGRMGRRVQQPMKQQQPGGGKGRGSKAPKSLRRWMARRIRSTRRRNREFAAIIEDWIDGEEYRWNGEAQKWVIVDNPTPGPIGSATA